MDNLAVKGYDGDEPTNELQSLVNEDMTRILEYGQDHADDYGGRWLNRPDRTYGVSFVVSVQHHDAALRKILHLPDRLSVQSRRHTFRAIIKVCDQLREDWNLGELADNGQPAISGWGPDEQEGIVRVRVQRSRPDVSARLVGKYGSLIAVEEGHYTTVLY